MCYINKNIALGNSPDPHPPPSPRPNSPDRDDLGDKIVVLDPIPNSVCLQIEVPCYC
jgi:hypothetical protein